MLVSSQNISTTTSDYQVIERCFKKEKNYFDDEKFDFDKNQSPNFIGHGLMYNVFIFNK